MPNPKKPSEKVEELYQAYNKLFVKTRSQNEIDELEKNKLNDTITLILSFIDNQHSQIQSLQKEVEELKKPVNQLCGVRGCNDHFMHAHLTP